MPHLIIISLCAPKDFVLSSPPSYGEVSQDGALREEILCRTFARFFQAPLGESRVSPIHPKMISCHLHALKMPKNCIHRQWKTLYTDVSGEAGWECVCCDG